MDIEERIMAAIPDQHEYLVGFASLKNFIDRKYGAFHYGIVIGKKMEDEIINSIRSGPNHEYYTLYTNTNRALSATMKRIADELQALNISCLLVEPTSDNEQKEDTTPYTILACDFSHKMVATRAGLGWIGKTDLLITERFGPRVRLTTMLTDHQLRSQHSPITESRCGTCRVCVKHCPAHAATGELWNIHVHRNEFYDAEKCRQTCKELAKKRLDIDLTLCGICVSVCPVGQESS